MIQNLRESLKGTVVAGVVFVLFIVPLVLTGVGDGSFLGSAAGTDAAEVEGKSITNAELRRAIYMRKQALLGQEGIDPSADYLKDENLRAPVLDNLTRRAALVVSAKEGGMGVSEEIIDKSIQQRPEFLVNGKFDPQAYRRLLGNIAYTPASYKAALREDFLLEQQSKGVNLSSFATKAELEDLVALIQQKRSFFTVKIPKDKVAESVTVTDEEISAYYEENKNNFVEPEKVSVKYIELSVDGLAKTVAVAEESIKAQFEQELKIAQNSDQFEVAHLLIEEKENQQEIIGEVQAKLAEGADFAELVMQYSDDGGSKDNGGNLGVLTPGIFPEAFENAVFELEQGAISEPVVTDAGTHFIKVLEKTVVEPPKFEERKDEIKLQLQTAEAEQIFADSIIELEELTFSADNLTEAAEALGLRVKTSAAFARNAGQGVADSPEVRAAAFSDEVLNKGYNSKLVEVSNTQAVVLRKNEYSQERIKDLEEVKPQITQALEQEKINAELDAIAQSLIEKISAGDAVDKLAEAEDYEYMSYEKTDRASSGADFSISSKAFQISLKNDLAVAMDTVLDREGNKVLIGVTSIVPGSRSDMEDQQFKGLTNQLVIQNGNFENAAYEDQIISNADIDIY